MVKHALLVLFGALLLGAAHSAESFAPRANRAQIMIVGVAHLEAKHDLHNSEWGRSVFDPMMQSQIEAVIRSIARFRPTKVMIEARATNTLFVRRYIAYRHGTYRLSSNEDDQYGYRLAKMLNLPTIYPIDSIGTYPFDFAGVAAAATKYHQQALLDGATASISAMVARTGALQRESRLKDDLRYINTPGALAANRNSYLWLDGIGAPPPNDAGAKLASYWYARNAEIFGNIIRDVQPGDRVVVFIGQGHASMLRPMIRGVSALVDVDPEGYL